MYWNERKINYNKKTYKNEKAATQFVKQCDNCKSIEDMQQHIKPKKEKANATKG